MDNALSPETQKKIESLCSEIARAESSSPDLHEELYAHIEDKVLGYLHGEEALTEADAYLLAREHFGDRLKLRQQLNDVHPLGVESHLTRRLLAITLFTVAVSTVVGSPLFILIYRTTHWFGFPPLFMLYLAPPLIVVGTLLYFARQCAAREAEGIPQWYERLSIPMLSAAVATLLLGATFVQHSLYSNYFTAQVLLSPIEGVLLWASILMHVGGGLLAWLVWCDRRVKSIRTMALVTMAFMLYYAVHQILGTLAVQTLSTGGTLYDAMVTVGNAITYNFSFMLPAVLVAWMIYLLLIRPDSKEHRLVRA